MAIALMLEAADTLVRLYQSDPALFIVILMILMDEKERAREQ
jgi:hypothetical protein